MLEGKIHFVNETYGQMLQLHIASINIGSIDEKLYDLFVDVTKEDYVDFYTDHKSERHGHITNRYTDLYGNHPKILHLNEDALKVIKSCEYVEEGALFVHMCKHMCKNKKRKVLLVLECY